LVLGVLATAVVLLVNAALSARSSAPARELAEQSYIDQVLSAVEDSTAQGRAVDTLRNQALHVSITTTFQRLGELVASAQRVLEAVQRIQPPSSMQTPHDLLEATLALRADGLRAFRDALASESSGRSNDSSVGALGDVGQDFQAADRAYRLLTKAAAPAGATLPSSEWVSDQTIYSQAGLEAFLTSLRSATSLTPIHDVAVVLVMTDPAPVSLNGVTETLPAASVLNIQAVIANDGNQVERNLLVAAVITPSADGPSAQVRNFVDLSPGQKRTVSLGGLHMKPGQLTVLTVSVQSTAGQAGNANNTRTLTIEMQ